MLKIEGGDRIPVNDVIPSPSYGLNYVLGGGFWSGRFSVVWGTISAGKTTMLLYTLAEAQKKGYIPVIVDAEGSYTDSWAEKCGLDLSNRIYIKSNITEHVSKELVDLMKSDEKFAIMIDSINAITAQVFYEDKKAIAIDARSRRKLIQELSEYMHPSKNLVLMVSQQGMDFSNQNRPTIMPKLGNAELHFATNIIRLFGSRASESLVRGENDLIINREVRWTVEKSKQAPVEGTRGAYWFSPQSATIDSLKEMVNIAVANGIIEKRGAWFMVDDNKYHGMDQLIDYLREGGDTAVQKIQEALDKTDLVFEVEE